jgi:hypothetical protein
LEKRVRHPKILYQCFFLEAPWEAGSRGWWAAAEEHSLVPLSMRKIDIKQNPKLESQSQRTQERERTRKQERKESIPLTIW